MSQATETLITLFPRILTSLPPRPSRESPKPPPTSPIRILALYYLSETYLPYETIDYSPWQKHFKHVDEAAATLHPRPDISSYKLVLDTPISPLNELDISPELYDDWISSVGGADEIPRVTGHTSWPFPHIRGKSRTHVKHNYRRGHGCWPQYGDASVAKERVFGKGIATLRREFRMNLEDTNEDAKVDKKVYELDEWKDDVVDESDIDDGNCVVVGGSAVVDDGSGVMTSESAIIDNSDEDGVSTGPTIQIKGFASRVDSMNLETIEGEEEGQRASREVDLPNEQMASEIEERLAKVEEARRRKRQERRAGR